MKNIVTGTDMKKVDSYTINTIGIPSLVLMERAALSVAEIVCKNQLKDKKILVVAGVGNNGADGVSNLSNITFKRLQHRVVHFR